MNYVLHLKKPRKEYIKKYMRKYRQKYKDQFKKLDKKRYQGRKEQQKEYEKNHCQLPHVKEARRLCNRKRCAIKRSLNFWESWMNDSWEGMLNQTKGYCPKCNKYVGKDKLTMDHILPLSKGGLHRIDNVQPMCLSCNCSKQDKI